MLEQPNENQSNVVSVHSEYIDAAECSCEKFEGLDGILVATMVRERGTEGKLTVRFARENNISFWYLFRNAKMAVEYARNVLA
jgi:CTP synthase (UTP-ammonia lyase)